MSELFAVPTLPLPAGEVVLGVLPECGHVAVRLWFSAGADEVEFAADASIWASRIALREAWMDCHFCGDVKIERVLYAAGGRLRA